MISGCSSCALSVTAQRGVTVIHFGGLSVFHRRVEGLVGGCDASVFTLTAMGAMGVGSIRYTCPGLDDKDHADCD